MGEPVVHKHAPGQWKNLCFILKPSEWRGEYHAVIIALKIIAGLALAVILFKAEAFVAYQALPIQT